jgi:hypothetical protein
MTRTSEMAGSTESEIAPPEAVNGPTVPGVEGSTSERLVDGTGLGMGASMEIGGEATAAGVAPVASTSRLAVPTIAEFPSAAAAPTIELGSGTLVWNPVRLNCSPAAGVAGEIVPAVVMSFNAMLPTGVPGQ